MLTPKQLAELRRSKPAGRNRVTTAMDLVGLTQVQLAERIGSSQPRISAICAGRYGDAGLPVETARSLADVFGCAIEDLFPKESQVA
jgi:DNA-binding XRE family transcriptional regulator